MDTRIGTVQFSRYVKIQWSPGWVTSSITVFFSIASSYLFEDLPKPHPFFSSNSVGLGADSALASSPPVPAGVPVEQYGIWQLSGQQWGVISPCFFILGSWDSNIPIFTAAAFNYTPYAAGNFIALGGIATLPFLRVAIFIWSGIGVPRNPLMNCPKRLEKYRKSLSAAEFVCDYNALLRQSNG
ncbi:hypothetical protein C8J57DRAFT_1254115 [Mycena rebaudengoi]|nr:hypothetical protein C8J57DRAFT_1254115 [Mycena rebaudengoi]